MIKKALLKFSTFLYKVHLFINEFCKEKSSFTPYHMNYYPSGSPIKIVHVNGNFIVGGTSQLIVDLVERTSDKYSHSIVVPFYSDPVPYQPVELRKFSVYEMSGLFNYLREEKPDLVHIHYWVRHEYRYEWYALWYRAVFKICEELDLKIIQNVNVPTKPYISSATLHTVFVSEYVLDNFNSENTGPSSVIYPGSNFKLFKNNHFNLSPGKSIGMVYRLDKDKLNEEAIEVFIRVVKKSPDVQCYIVGDGDYLTYYKKRVEQEGLSANFIFTGLVSYKLLPDYYKKIGVFVAPVHDESFGQVTPFAMSMGLCIAGYDIGALSEILGYSDTLVEYGNIEGLADVILDLLVDPERRKSLGAFNQERAHRYFSVENMIDQYNRLYAQCLS